MRHFQFPPNKQITPCPNCGNNTEFKAHSQRCAEDYCEVWVECICGFDPTSDRPAWRLESAMGGTGDRNVRVAMVVWNDMLAKQGRINEQHSCRS